MKRLCFLIVCLLLVFGGLLCQTWNFDYVDPENCEQSAAAIDQNGKIHVVYYKKVGWPWNTNYAVQTDQGWDVQTVAASNGMHSIAVDGQNKPHVVFIGKDYSLNHATLTDDGQWQITKLDSSDLCFENSIQVDKNNHVHISYTNGKHELRYAYYDGTTWTIEQVDTSGMVGFGNVLALDSQNRPHILHGDGNHNTMKYCYWDGSQWQTTQFEMNQYHNGWVVCNDKDQPCISCTGDNGLLLLTYDGSQWTEQVIDPPPAGAETGKWNSLGIDHSDSIYFAFGWTNNWMSYYLYYAYHDGSTWNVQPVDTSEAMANLNATCPRIFADLNNELHIIYTTKNGAIKHATTAVGTGIVSKESKIPRSVTLYQNFPNPFNATTKIKYTIAENGYVHLAVYDLSGRKIRTLLNAFQNRGSKQIKWDGTNDQGRAVGSGVYLYRLDVKSNNGRFIQTKKMILLK